ncbi:PLP-dependent cysteine synthase family protein [Burkholderia gladioli]|uniref:PLP-dependent cysteine synthase family protein n=1 Tax=Burkholderia gladioli TaxID=28095 RepID=UPI00163FD076|nr:cysteine synthase family protein [Burkholderia gladioli]
MKAFDSVLDAVGHTPLVRIRRVVEAGQTARLFAKLEFMNPGGSIKDRLVRHLIRHMEASGELSARSVLVENSSGNTGAALSMAAAAHGLRCIVTIPDKMSREKISRMRAYGTEVVVAPTAVAAEDPRSYYSVARQLADTTPDAIYPDQYNNPLNAEAHYASTGPEIWEQTEGEIDVLVAGIGTGGTISGIGRYLKERKPEVQVIGVDPIGSIFHDYFHHRRMSTPHTYQVEGIGEDYLVKAVDFDVIDDIVQVDDQESFLMARRLVREEGILCGGSSGSAMSVASRISARFPGRNIVVILPDSGNMYLSKFLDDDWMRANGYPVEALRHASDEVPA